MIITILEGFILRRRACDIILLKLMFQASFIIKKLKLFLKKSLLHSLFPLMIYQVFPKEYFKLSKEVIE